MTNGQSHGLDETAAGVARHTAEVEQQTAELHQVHQRAVDRRTRQDEPHPNRRRGDRESAS